MERMKYIPRYITTSIQHALDRKKSVLLLGARQTGKTTLLSRFNVDLAISLVRPAIRQRYEKNPDLLTGEVEAIKEDLPHQPLIWIDEVQKVPVLLDVLQDLMDRQVAQFLLTGSSARRLRAQMNMNWLPGRLVILRLDPLTQEELSQAQRSLSLETLLIDGSLPGIINTQNTQDREIDLSSYAQTYLEEEVRAEALVRQIGTFAKFLQFAAAESGKIINFRKLSQEIGIAHTTIASYYQILEDCLIIESISPLTKSAVRRRLMKTPKYLFFDLGVRRTSAQEPRVFPQIYWGHLFEQWVGLELIRYLRQYSPNSRLYFWRDANGPEVDWVIEHNHQYIPIEVKWTDSPRYQDVKHLALFQKEYPQATKAWLICRTPRKIKLADNIYACSWEGLASTIFETK
jgi:uncharacterized protein